MNRKCLESQDSISFACPWFLAYGGMLYEVFEWANEQNINILLVLCPQEANCLVRDTDIWCYAVLHTMGRCRRKKWNTKRVPNSAKHSWGRLPGGGGSWVLKVSLILWGGRMLEEKNPPLRLDCHVWILTQFPICWVIMDNLLTSVLSNRCVENGNNL